MAFVSLPGSADATQLSEVLGKLSLPGIALRGNVPLWCGVQRRPKIAEAVKQALDPENRFPGLDE